MKVALVIGTLQRGGSERQVVELVRSAHPHRAECVVICLGREGPLAGEVRAVGARVLALGAESLTRPRNMYSLARTLRRERPDVVYAFLFWGYVLALPLAALVAPSALRIQARRSLPPVDVPKRRALVRLRWIADRCAHGAIANSMTVGRAVADAEPSMAGRLWVVPNGVGEAAPAPRPEGPSLTILCVANLIAYKGHATLIAALTRLRPGAWRALLAGDGPERLSVERMIVANHLQARAQLLGRRADVGELLDLADVAVLPSYAEGMPNAVLEAMAHAVPVVASDVGGVRGLLGSGAGIVVPVRNEVALAAALQRLIDDAGLRRAMGERGRELVRDSLSTAVMRDATLRAFEEIGCRRSSRLRRLL
jgi:L-malate glycosyltransferase